MENWFCKRGYKNFVKSEVVRTRNCNRKRLLSYGSVRGNSGRTPLVIGFHPALARVPPILQELQSILFISEKVKIVFSSFPLIVSYRKPRSFKQIFFRARLPKESNETTKGKGMHKCGKSSCKICEVVESGNRFSDRLLKVSYIILLIVIHRVWYIFFSARYAGCNMEAGTINSFRVRYNNPKSSLTRYGKGRKRMPGKKLYSHFYGESRLEIKNVEVIIIDIIDLSCPTERESFWAYTLNSCCPQGLSLKDFEVI